MKEKVFPAVEASIDPAVLFIEAELKDTSVARRQVLKTMLSVEELLVQMIRNAESPETEIHVGVKLRRRSAVIRITCRGRAFHISCVRSDADLSALDEVNADFINALMLRTFTDALRLHTTRGVNRASITVRGQSKFAVNPVVAALLLGAMFGLLLRLLPVGAVSAFLSENLFSPVSALFFSAVKMIVIPLVFFCIAESIAGFTDFRTFGRIGSKVMVLFQLTAFASMLVGLFVFNLMPVGDVSQKAAVLAAGGASDVLPSASISLKDTLVNIVPSNILSAFLNADMLQIIFLAVITGFSVASLGEYSGTMQRFLTACNRLFSRMSAVMMHMLPVAVFCIMGNTVLTTDTASVMTMLRLVLILTISIIVLAVMYTLVMMLLTRRNPLIFYRKMQKALITALTTASGSATSPITMDCLKNLGVSPKVYSFSIPLATVINTVSANTYHMVSALFMIRVFGLKMDFGMMATLLLTVYLLSLSTPGMPGSGIASVALLISQFGIPAGASGYLVSLITVMDFLLTALNVLYHSITTVIVADSEGLIDDAQYRSAARV